MYRINSLLYVIAAFGLLASFNAKDANAQETAQVIVSGFPSVLNSPFLDDIRNDYDSGLLRVQFNYISNSTFSRDFRFEISLSKDGQTLITETSNIVSYEPGTHFIDPFFDLVSFPIEVDDFIDGLGSKILNQLAQTGSFPEGSYSLRIRAVPEAQNPVISSIPGILNFAIRLPQPPVLVTPPDNGQVLLDIPIFTWTPVVGFAGLMVEYGFLLVELHDNQNPGDAILSNPPYFETVTSQTALPYTPDLFPLEQGKMYAWQVTASDVNQQLPFSGDGESEINTFVFGQIADDGPGPPAELELIPLITQFLEVVDFEMAEIRKEGNHLVLDGIAYADISFSGRSTETVQVYLQDLRIIDANLQNPVIVSGSVEIDSHDLTEAIQDLLPENSTLTNTRWTLAGGMQSEIFLGLPLMEPQIADGLLAINSFGINGFAQISGQPIHAFADEYVEIELETYRVDFPSVQINASGTTRILGRDSGCDLSNLTAVSETLSGSFNCQDSFDIPLVDDSPMLRLQTDRVLGNIGINLSTGTLDYDLVLRSSIGLLTENGNYCGSGVNIGLDNADGVFVQQLYPKPCPDIVPNIPLGFANLLLSNTDVDFVSYDNNSGLWDFQLNISAGLLVPAFDDWQSSTITDIMVDRDGITFNAISFEDAIAPLPVFNLQQLRLQLDGFSLPDFTYPLFGWDGQLPGPWEIDFTGTATVRSGQQVPSCLAGQQLSLINGHIDHTQQRIVGTLDALPITSCQFAPAPTFSMEVTNLSGIAGVRYMGDGGLEPFGILATDGHLVLEEPFDCSGSTQNSHSFSGNQLSMSTGLNGHVGYSGADCKLPLGPFMATVNSGTFVFEKDDWSDQHALLEADASILLPNGNHVDGSFSYDMMQAEYVDLNFSLDEPFEWNMPNDDQPQITLLINDATLTSEGINVNGRHSVKVDGLEGGATYDNLIIDLETNRISSGRVLLDDGYGIFVHIHDDLQHVDMSLTGPDFQIGDYQGIDRFLWMETGAQTIIDSDGFKPSSDQTQNATLHFDGQTFDQLSVSYKDGFSLHLSTFSVHLGQADFQLPQGELVANLDEGGFHPNMEYFDVNTIPEYVPLPHSQVAMLQLRDGDEYFVNVNPVDGGNILLEAKPGNGPRLHLHYFDQAGTIVLQDVVMQDFVITRNLMDPQFVSGRIEVEIDDNDMLSDLTGLGIPLFTKQLVFESRLQNGTEITALFFEGDLSFLGRRISGGEQVVFYLRNDNRLRANINLHAHGGILPLWDDRLQLQVETLNGSFTFTGGSVQTSDFTVGGMMELRADDGFFEAGSLIINLLSDGFTDIQFQTVVLDQPKEFDFHPYTLQVDGLRSIEGFTYSQDDGLDFRLVANANLVIPINDMAHITAPLRTARFNEHGLRIPVQDINESTLPGINFSAFQLSGFDLTPIALSFKEPNEFAWGGIESAHIAGLEMDAVLAMPEFLEETALNPADGLLFNNLVYEDGYLTGQLEPWEPIGGASIPVSASHQDDRLRINTVNGEITKDDTNGQQINVLLGGSVESLSVFDNILSLDCPDYPGLVLEVDAKLNVLIGVQYDFQPCGSIITGPLTLTGNEGKLVFSADNDGKQLLTFQSLFDVHLSHDHGTGLGSGDLSLNALDGSIIEGAVDIATGFQLPVRWDREQHFFELSINTARLDASGLTLLETGELLGENISHEIVYNDFLLDLNDFKVISGSASIEPEIQMQVGLSPVTFQFIDENADAPTESYLRFTINETLTLDHEGLKPVAGTNGFIHYQGVDYDNLHVEFSEDAAIGYGGLNMRQGSISFYTSQSDEEPLAVLSSSVFTMEGAPVAELPEKLFLPDEQTGWLQLRDDQGAPLVSISPLDGGLQLISSGDATVPLVLPGIGNLEMDVAIELTVDGLFNISDGSVLFDDRVSLSNLFENLPLFLSKLELDTDDGLRLIAGITADLPTVFSGSESMAPFMVPFGAQGLLSGYYSIGYNNEAFDPDAEPLFTNALTGPVNDSEDDAHFSVNLLGIEAALGSKNQLWFTATLESSLIKRPANGAGNRPFMLRADWIDNNWEFLVEPQGTSASLALGLAELHPEGNNPYEIHYSNDHFLFSVNGLLSFTSVLNEELNLQISGLTMGMDGLQDTPSIHFGMLEDTEMPEFQSFELFNAALLMELVSPALSVEGTTLAIQGDGMFTYFNHDLPFEGFYFDTAGEVRAPEIDFGDDKLNILGEYITLVGLELSFEENTKLKLTSDFDYILPEPFDEKIAETSLALSVTRNENGNVIIEQSGLTLLFDDDAMAVQLGQFGEIDLQRIRAVIDPFDYTNVSLFASAKISVWDTETGDLKPVIFFGDENNDGIGVSYLNNEIDIFYNVTGNVGFSFDMSFFRLGIEAGITTTSENQGQFGIALGGSAGLTLSGVSSDMGFEDIKVGKMGISDFGRLSGPATISVINSLVLEVGNFFRHSDENGFDLTLTDTSEKNPEELREMAGDNPEQGGQTKVVSGVNEVVCFGPCPFEIDGMDPSGGGENNALKISIGGNQSDFSGGVDAFYFYRAGNNMSLSVEGVSMELSDIFSMRADFQYAQEDGGVLVRAAGTGTFNIGNNQIGALVAGKFSNIGDEVSFGFFVAGSSSAGVPIIPGIVSLTGAGGGFFYNPEQADLEMIAGAMGNFGHTIVDRDAFVKHGDSKFVVMLYGAVGVVGSAGNYVLEGSSFISISNTGLYLDARVFALGMKRGGPNSHMGTEVRGEIAVSLEKGSTGVAAIFVVGLDVEIPNVMSGKGSVEFFYYKPEGSREIWGLIGNAGATMFGGVLTGAIDVLANNDGFVLEIAVEFSLSVPVVSVKSGVEGALWVLDGNKYTIPMGAYVVFYAEADLKIITISAEARGAIAKRGNNLDLMASVRGCATINYVLGTETVCGSAWLAVRYPGGVSGGLGSGGNGNLISEALAQRNQFRGRINTMLAQLRQAQLELEYQRMRAAYPSDEEYATAGFHLYSKSREERVQWAHSIIEEEEKIAPIPDRHRYVLGVRSSPLISQKPDSSIPDDGSYALEAFQELQTAIESTEAVLKAFSYSENGFGDMLAEAHELMMEAESVFEDLVGILADNPMQILQRPTASTTSTQTLVFDLNEDLAIEQDNALQQINENSQQLDIAFRAAIGSVENNLTHIEQILYSTDGSDSDNTNIGSSIMESLHVFKDLIERFEYYHAAKAQEIWNEIIWSVRLRNNLVNRRSSIAEPEMITSDYHNNDPRYETTLTRFAHHYYHFYNGIPGTTQEQNNFKMDMFLGMRDAAYREAQRVHIVTLLNDPDYELSPGNFSWLTLPHDGFSPGDDNMPGSALAPNAEKAYGVYNVYEIPDRWDTADTIDKWNSIEDKIEVIVRNEAKSSSDFWYNLHYDGLGLYLKHNLDLFDGSGSDISDGIIAYKMDQANELYMPLFQVTELIDEFFTIQANITSILWNLNHNYIEWRSEIVRLMSENEGASDLVLLPTDAPDLGIFIESRLGLSERLMPPHITNLSATINVLENKAYSPVEITWAANHGHKITENSFQYNIDGNDGEKGFLGSRDQYITLGLNESQAMNTGSILGDLTLMPFLRTENRNGSAFTAKEPVLNIGVRVRGAAGNTSIMHASLMLLTTGFSGYTDTNIGSPPIGPIHLQLPPPTQIPRVFKPQLSLSSYYNSTTGFETTTVQGPDGSDREIETEKITYWTNNPLFITMTVHAYDASHITNSIVSFEYKIGTKPGADDVLDWTEMQGERRFIYQIPAYKMVANTQFIQMAAGQEYYISVRATNASGQVSEVHEHENPIIFDGTPPSVPTVSHLPQQAGTPPVASGLVLGASNVVPPLLHTIQDIETIKQPELPTTLRFTDFSATDDDSGVLYFEYALSKEETVPYNRFDTDDFGLHIEGLLTIEGSMLDPYFDEFNTDMWLHVRAVDVAGNKGEIATYGPFTSEDNSNPYPGELVAKLDPQDIKLYIQKVPYDPETDITGIQYAFVERSYTFNATGHIIDQQDEYIIDFPTGTDVNWEWDLLKSKSLINGTGGVSRFISIPRAGLNIGNDFYIKYRSVNNRGLFSNQYETGPVNLDTTPPLEPIISVSANKDSGVITVNVSNIHDPESGVSQVSIGPPVGHTKVIPLFRRKDNAFVTEHIPTGRNFIDEFNIIGTQVTVSIRNGAGLVRTAHYTIVEDDVYSDGYSVPIPSIPPRGR